MAPARSIASLFARWRSRVFPSRRDDPAHRLGLRGETFAARFLKRHGYKVLFRRFRPRRGGGEIDIVCRHGDTLVFVEVKTRTGTGYGRPLEAVGADKQHLIVRGAFAWLRMLPETLNPLYRFDVVEVMVGGDGKTRCEIIENAFVPADRLMR